jgi:hypothetical protein
MLNETELIGAEITHLKPRRATWKNWAEAAIGVALIAFFVYSLIVFAAASLK